MECREVRELAEAYVSEQLLVETAEAIVAHLDRCASCRSEMSGLQRLRASVRAGYLNAVALAPPPEFLASVSARLRAATAPAPRVSSSHRTWIAVAATLVLIVGGGLGLRGFGVAGFTAIVRAAVGDHRFCSARLAERPIALEQAAQVYDDPVDRSLEAVEPAPAELNGEPIRIVERHSCIYDGRRFAHFVLRYKQGVISLVVTPDARLLRGLPGASVPADGSIARLSPADGFQIAAFRGAHHVAFLISTLSDADVRDVAGAVQASVLRAMNSEK